MAKFDVFVSYAHSDGTEASRLVAALERQGLAVWQDSSGIDDFASITRGIVAGLNESKALVAYYSSTYPTRRACQWELTAGVIGSQGRSDGDARVLLVNPEDTLDHIQPVALRDLLLPPSSDSDELAKRIAAHVDSLSGTLKADRTLVGTRWFGLKPSGSPTFVGRLTDMWALHSALNGSDQTVISEKAPTSKSAQLTGLGGIGKSLLAEEYAIRFGAAYPGGVFWLRAYGNDDLRAALSSEQREAERQSQILGFARDLDLDIEELAPDQVEARVANALDAANEPVLWVVDDLPADLNAEEFHRWSTAATVARTLYTTRSRQYGALAEPIDLGQLPPEDGYALLTARVSAEDDDERAAARQIAEELGGLALALDVASQSLRAQRGYQNYAGFLETLRDPTGSALELAEELADVLPTGHEKGIAKTLLSSIERLGPEGLDFLILASVLATAPIPPELVTETLACVDQLSDSEASEKAVRGRKEAERRSLASEPDSGGAVTVHTLVSQAVGLLANLDMAARRLALRQAAGETLLGALGEAIGTGTGAMQIPHLLPHARKLATAAESRIEAKLLGAVSHLDRDRGAFTSSLEGFQQQARRLRELFGERDPHALQGNIDLALAYERVGRLDEAIRLFDSVLMVFNDKHGMLHPETLYAATGLAGVYVSAGEFSRALVLYQSILPPAEHVLGNLHTLTLSVRNNLAYLYQSMGQFEQAISLYDFVLGAREQTSGADHRLTLTARHNLAGAYLEGGHPARAVPLFEKAVQGCTTILGPENVDTLESRACLARARLAADQGDAAIAEYESLLADVEALFGSDNSRTIELRNELIDAYERLGRWEDSIRSWRDRLATVERAHGPEAEPSLTARNRLAEALMIAGRFEEAIAIFTENLAHCQKVLPPDDFRISGTERSLATAKKRARRKRRARFWRS